MKRLKRMLGVTLLEVMLVLAIAAMIIVMSIRYYQSASSAQQANTILSQIQGIVAAADSLSQASGSYDSGGSSSVTNTNLQPLLPGGSLTTPWGDPITVTVVNSSSYSMNLGNVPSGVCPLLMSRLQTNNHFKQPLPTCSATQSTPATITYVANP